MNDTSQQRTSIVALIQKFTKASNVDEGMRVFGEGLDMESVAYAEFICEVEDEWDVELELDKLGPIDQTVGQLTDHILDQLNG